MKYLLFLLVALVAVVGAAVAASSTRLGSPEARKLGGSLNCYCCKKVDGKYPGCGCPLRKKGYLNNSKTFEKKCEKYC